MVSEAVDMRAAFSVRMGLPLPSTAAGHHGLYQQAAHHHHHLLMPSGPPFFPPPPPPAPLDSGGGDYGSSGGSPESPGYIHKQMQLLEQAGHHPHVLMASLYPGAPITDAQVRANSHADWSKTDVIHSKREIPNESLPLICPARLGCCVRAKSVSTRWGRTLHLTWQKWIIDFDVSPGSCVSVCLCVCVCLA